MHVVPHWPNNAHILVVDFLQCGALVGHLVCSGDQTCPVEASAAVEVDHGVAAVGHFVVELGEEGGKAVPAVEIGVEEEGKQGGGDEGGVDQRAEDEFVPVLACTWVLLEKLLLDVAVASLLRSQKIDETVHDQFVLPEPRHRAQTFFQFFDLVLALIDRQIPPDHVVVSGGVGVDDAEALGEED